MPGNSVGELLATKASVIRLRNIVCLGALIACIGAVLARWRRRAASRRVVAEVSDVASRAVDTWENEGGSIPEASDVTGDGPRQMTDAGPG